MADSDLSPHYLSPVAMKADETTGPRTIRPRFHRTRRVKPHHASGSWTVCIGKALGKSGKSLRRKDWYFAGMSEADANDRAASLQREWEFLVTNWVHLYGGRLRIINSPFADIPHWQPNLSSRAVPTPAEIDAVQNQPPTSADLIDAYAQVSLLGVFSLFDQQKQVTVAQGDIQQTTYRALVKSLRGALTYFNSDLRMASLTHGEIQTAKTKMLAKLSRRTVRNRLIDLRRMLKWFYDSDYGQGHERPTHFDEVFGIKNANRTDIETYGPDVIRDILKFANAREQLYVMLALNCGMYQADIGRLTLDELDEDNSFVFWDREKEPQNPFKVKHDLWPETRELVSRFSQARKTRTRFDTEWRDGSKAKLDCSTLAFVDTNGNMLYRITESGRAYDKISKAMQRLNVRLKNEGAATFKFNSLRKSTNQLLCEILESRTADDDAQGMVATSEISNLFLAQKSNLLTRLYRTTGVKLYGRMNRHLQAVGTVLRDAGAFEPLSAW